MQQLFTKYVRPNIILFNTYINLTQIQINKARRYTILYHRLLFILAPKCCNSKIFLSISLKANIRLRRNAFVFSLIALAFCIRDFSTQIATVIPVGICSHFQQHWGLLLTNCVKFPSKVLVLNYYLKKKKDFNIYICRTKCTTYHTNIQ